MIYCHRQQLVRRQSGCEGRAKGDEKIIYLYKIWQNWMINWKQKKQSVVQFNICMNLYEFVSLEKVQDIEWPHKSKKSKRAKCLPTSVALMFICLPVEHDSPFISAQKEKEDSCLLKPPRFLILTQKNEGETNPISTIDFMTPDLWWVLQESKFLLIKLPLSFLRT